MISQEAYARMSDEEVADVRASLAEQRKELAPWMGSVDSHAARSLLAKRKRELDEVRKEYNGVVVVGADPTKAIMHFHAIQVRERFISADIDMMENASNLSKTLDEEMKECDRILRKRQKASEGDR